MSAPTQTQPAAPLPGAYFDIPGVPGGATQWTEQDDSTTNLVTTMQQAAQVPINGITPYKQVDVVSDWFMMLTVTQTYTTGSSTLTASAYAPFNVLGPVKQLIQNQYASVDVESGIDLYIFNLIRPFRSSEILSGVNNYANPAGDPVGGTATGYPTTALAQVNQLNAVIWQPSVTSYNLTLRLPAAQWFDRYYDLLVTGEPTTQPHPALVSPQYLAGTTRNITPTFMLASGSSAITDLGPVNIGAGSGTFTGSANLRLRRQASYAGSQMVQPPVYSWQYRWKTQRFSASGQSKLTLPVPLDTGQLLSIYVRMFDPSAASGLGAPININTVTGFQLQYGSGLLWIDALTLGGVNAAAILQRRWLSQHSTQLPAGVLACDLGLDERQQMTNARALNTLTTAGILVSMTFSAPLSATAYVTMGTESLVYVS